LDEVFAEHRIRKSRQWQDELRNIRLSLARHESAAAKNYELGIGILELAKGAYDLYLQQSDDERRKLLNTILSNCSFVRGTLYPTYNKPFDILARTDKIENWRPQRDSNPCCRIESAVS
jgi:site-specific DNA recombinase